VAVSGNQASLIVQGKDRGGIVAAVASVLAGHGASIVSLDQYSDDPQGGAFFQRTVFGLDNLPAVLPAIEKDLRKALERDFDLRFTLRDLSVQILSGEFIAAVGVPIINIHHSFLPAFIGAGPYAKAKERGVKLIGATAHYVTEDLDEGPIIEQDVVRVTHAETAGDLQRRGADVERMVLARAVEWHSEDRVLRHGNQAIVFA
jgi:formyltetrahydrofolate hydrolase